MLTAHQYLIMFLREFHYLYPWLHGHYDTHVHAVRSMTR
jgi:hypothetical protein